MIGFVQSHEFRAWPPCDLDKGKGNLVHTHDFSICGTGLQETPPHPPRKY